MAAATTAAAASAATAVVVDRDNENYDELDDPEFPEIMMTIQTDTKTLGTLFEKNDGRALLFDSHLDRVENLLKYRIPFRQRYGITKWKENEKQKLVDSVFKGFTLEGITVSFQYDAERRIQYYDLENGATRMSILQSYTEDGFKYKGKFYSELDERYKNRFDRFMIPITIIEKMPDAPENTIDELFYRLNLGKSLTDADRYWSMQDASPLVKSAFKVMKEPFWDSKMMKTEKFGDKSRSCLPNVCSILATLYFGKKYTSSSSRLLEPILKKGVDYEVVKNKVKAFLKYYKEIIVESENEPTVVSQQMGWHKSSKQMAPIMHDYLDDPSEEALVEKKSMWIDIMKTARRAENFWFGKQTIWNGLSKNAKQNLYVPAIKVRLNRVKEFADITRRAELCAREHIEWE